VWIRADQPGRTHDQIVPLDRERRPEPAMLDRNPDWKGEIALVALGIKGAMQAPWTLRSVRIEPVGTTAVVSDIVRGWRAFEGWDGRSINVLFGGREEQRAWLPALAFAASLAAALAMLVVARRRGRRATTIALVAPFIAGWLVLDLRWQANLVEQARATIAQFGGRDWEARHLAMEDADLFKFVQSAVAKMPSEPQRVFVGSDFEYFRRRAGYHLYPHNVLAYSWGEAFQLKPGEYLLLYQKHDVKFDGAAQELLWDNGRRLDAIPVIAQRGAGLFLVGPKGGR
jgi:hypothetical protein